MVAAINYTPHDFLLDGMELADLLATGETPSATTGDTFDNTGKEVFVFMNASGANTKTVVLEEGSCNYGTDHDPVRNIGTSKKRAFGPFPTSEFGTSIAVTYGGTGGVTDVTVLVLRMPFTN